MYECKPIRRLTIWVVAALLLLCWSQVCSADNLLLNPGFETAIATYAGAQEDGTPTIVNTNNWTIEFISAGVVYCWPDDGSIYPKGTHEGNNAQKTHTDGDGNAKLYQDVYVQPGTAYTASVWVWGIDVAGIGFGHADTDSAGLTVREYKADGTENGVHGKYEITTPSSGYVLLTSPSFTVAADTVKVRYELEVFIACNYMDGTVKWDDCHLDGARPTANITGTVTSNGSPVDGATVTAGTSTATTGVDGTYVIPSMGVSSGYTVRAAKTGCFAQRKYRTVASEGTVVDFNLVAVASNIVTNAGLDDGWTDTEFSLPLGWLTDKEGMAVRETNRAGTINCGHSGDEAFSLESTYVGKEGMDYQDIRVVPNSPYTAKAWACARFNGTDPATDCTWGTDPTQQAALVVFEMDNSGAIIATHDKVYLTDFSNWQELVPGKWTTSWQQLSTGEFTTLPNTAFIRIGGWAKINDNREAHTSRAVFDDFELNGILGVGPKLYGFVKSGTTPLAGATVTLDDPGATSTTTAANGYWEFAVTSGTYRIRAAKDGYYPMRLTRGVPATVNFDLTPVGTNLVAHAGFDDNPAPTSYPALPYGWQTNNSGFYTRGSAWGIFAHSGEESASLIGDSGPPEEGMIYQDIPVMSETSYTASVWARALWVTTTTAWGTDPNQIASLYVQEMDKYAQPVGAAQWVDLSTYTDWQQLTTGAFTTSSTTRLIRIGGYANLMDNYQYNLGRATFDDFALNGPAGPAVATFSGYVTSGSTPIAGATVTAGGVTATTGADGYYEIFGVTGGGIEVRASRAGYYAVRVKKNAYSAVDFDLVPANLVAHAGFEDMPISWGYPNSVASWSITKDWGWHVPAVWAGSTPYAGAQSATLVNPDAGSPVQVMIYQDVPVFSNKAFTASVWGKSWSGALWGIDENQKGGLSITELNASGGIILEHPKVLLTDFVNWEQLSTAFTADPNTTAIRIGGWVQLVDSTWVNLARMSFDNFNLSYAPGSLSLSEIKAMPNGSSVTLNDAIVSASFDGFFYIESADRSSGIKVTGSAAAGDLVTVVGMVETVNGEKQITSTTVTPSGTGIVPRPLGMNNNAANGKAPAVGLLVKAWGRVAAPGGNVFVVSDGSVNGLKVYGPSGYTASAGSYVAVTGALGAEMAGETVVPVIHAVAVGAAE